MAIAYLIAMSFTLSGNSYEPAIISVLILVLVGALIECERLGLVAVCLCRIRDY